MSAGKILYIVYAARRAVYMSKLQRHAAHCRPELRSLSLWRLQGQWASDKPAPPPSGMRSTRRLDLRLREAVPDLKRQNPQVRLDLGESTFERNEWGFVF